MNSKPMYFVAFIMVNIICIDSGNSATAAKDAVDPSGQIIEGLGGLVKKQIPEQYQPALEPVIDVATQTIKESVKGQDPKELAKSFVQNIKDVAGYVKGSMPSAQCVKETILSTQAAVAIGALEAGVAYILISDARISRQVKQLKLIQLNQTREDLYQDSRVINCLNDADNCNETDFNLAKEKFSRDIDNMIKDIQHHINWKQQVMIPGGVIATAGAAGLAGYSFYTAGATMGSAIYTIGAAAIGYGTAEQIFTYWELKECIKQVKEALEKELSKLNLECEYILDIN